VRRFFMRAIRDYEAAQAETAQLELFRHRTELVARESTVGGAKDRIRHAAKRRQMTTPGR
jgi:hypothetical protein